MNDPMDAFAAQLDATFRAANDALLGTAEAWNAVLRAHLHTVDAARQAFGGLLVDWHQRFFVPPGR